MLTSRNMLCSQLLADFLQDARHLDVLFGSFPASERAPAVLAGFATTFVFLRIKAGVVSNETA